MIDQLILHRIKLEVEGIRKLDDTNSVFMNREEHEQSTIKCLQMDIQEQQEAVFSDIT